MHHILPLLWIAALMTGCQTLRPEEMASPKTTYGGTVGGTVAVLVGGGSGGVKWFSGTVEPEELAKAITLSLERSDLFAGLADAAMADYVLAADLTYAGSHPGFNLTAWLNIAWSLTRHGEEEPLWSQEIKAEGEATVGEAFNATTRQYIALERAGQSNIEQAFAEMAQLPPSR